MTAKRFEVMDWLIETKPWDLFWFVEIGVDRVHHAFWKYHRHGPSSLRARATSYENVIIDYYKFLDEKIGAPARKAAATTPSSWSSPTTGPSG